MLERIHQVIKHEKSPPSIVVDLLRETLIGTEGTLYQLMDTPEKIHQLHSPHFIYLERHGKAIGNVTLCERQISFAHETVRSYYIRYFAFQKLFQGSSKKGNARSGFHQYFEEFFKTSNLNPIQPVYDKSIYWAFIDPENARSFNMNTLFGFETIGSFKTKAFSRVRPKQRNVERLSTIEQPAVMQEIKTFYRGYNFFSSTHLFENNNYFVLRENNEIICGIQANPVHWKIKSLPGLQGKLMLKLAPYLPGIRKLINPKAHRFLATEGLFWKPGKENFVASLLEGVLSITNHHSLLIWEDQQAHLLNKLPLNWGFIQKIKKDNTVSIVAKFNGYSLAEIESFRSNPKYLSGFDMT